MRANPLFFLVVAISFTAAVACGTSGSSGSNAIGPGGDGAGTAGFVTAGRGEVITAGTGEVITAGTGEVITAGTGEVITAGTGGTGGVITAGTGGTVTAGTGGTVTAGTGGTGGTAGVADETVGCDGASLLDVPADTRQRGPWPVGHLETSFGSFGHVVVLYPAAPGSEADAEEVWFDVRVLLPDAERAKIPDSDAKPVSVQTYRGLPLDDAHGPYPAVVLVHGTASFAEASATPMAHWASRGFIVMAAQHPGLNFTDHIASCALIPFVSTTLGAEVDSEIAALNNPTGDLAFLAGHVDMSRIALAGHSAGAYNVAQFSNKPGVQVEILLSGNMNVSASSSLKSTLYISGLSDAVLPFNPGGPGIGIAYFPGILGDGSQSGAYAASPPRKRIIGITGGGHLTVTDLCQTNNNGQNAMEVMQARGVGCLGIIPALFDCGPVGQQVDWKVGIDIVADATAAVLEETLHCKPQRTSILSGFQSRYTQIGHFEEEL
jgi:hypothetical protein